MINCYLDLETIPDQTSDAWLPDMSTYKPPSSLTKAQVAADFGWSEAEAKIPNKAEAIALWVKKFGMEAAMAAADHEWRKTSFDGGQGEVISIAWAVGDGDIFSHQRTNDPGTEHEMVGDFFGLLEDEMAFNSKGWTLKPYFIGHNIPFDLKFLFRRAVILGIKPPFELPFNGYHGKDYYDNMYAWCGRGDRISQDNLCKALGLEGKPDGIDGSKVWDEVKAGNIDKVVEYNRDDVRAVREVYKRLTFGA